MKTTLKQYFGTQSLDIQCYHMCQQVLEGMMNQTRITGISCTENGGLKQSINVIEHEVACMDETMECFMKLTCNSTRKKLQECVTFTWETYLDESMHIQLAVSGILSEFENPINMSDKTTSLILRVEDLKKRFRRLKVINTEKWMNLRDFRLVLFVIRYTSESFEKLESFEISISVKHEDPHEL